MDCLRRPLLFLDVDGPLIPFGGTPGHESDSSPLPARQHGANPLLTRLDPELGPLLSALPCELVWATTWMHEANRSVGPALGLPTLAVVDWPERPDAGVLGDQRGGLFRYFTLTPADLAFVDPGRGPGPADRLGLAVALCTLPWLGFVPDRVTTAPPVAVARLGEQLKVDAAQIGSYGKRVKTRTEHLRLAAQYLGWRTARTSTFSERSKSTSMPSWRSSGPPGTSRCGGRDTLF